MVNPELLFQRMTRGSAFLTTPEETTVAKKYECVEEGCQKHQVKNHRCHVHNRIWEAAQPDRHRVHLPEELDTRPAVRSVPPLQPPCQQPSRPPRRRRSSSRPRPQRPCTRARRIWRSFPARPSREAAHWWRRPLIITRSRSPLTIATSSSFDSFRSRPTTTAAPWRPRSSSGSTAPSTRRPDNHNNSPCGRATGTVYREIIGYRERAPAGARR